MINPKILYSNRCSVRCGVGGTWATGAALLACLPEKSTRTRHHTCHASVHMRKDSRPGGGRSREQTGTNHVPNLLMICVCEDPRDHSRMWFSTTFTWFHILFLDDEIVAVPQPRDSVCQGAAAGEPLLSSSSIKDRHGHAQARHKRSIESARLRNRRPDGGVAVRQSPNRHPDGGVAERQSPQRTGSVSPKST